MDSGSKIYVAGHRGLVGSAIVRKLQAEGYTNLILRTSAELDLRDQTAVAAFFREERPEYVFLAAARVGGIVANNSYPAEFIYDNLMIQCNVIHHAYVGGVRKLLFLGSTCIYPKLAPQPMKEEYLLTGPLEPTNEPYAIAKIAGIKMCQSYNRQYGTRFLAAMPTNLYGPNDNFDLETSHVLPALMRKFHEAKVRQGSGIGRFSPLPGPQSPVPALINVGTGEEVSIRELALSIKRVVGHEGELVFDASKPDGTPRKLSDVSRLHGLGWRHRIGLEEGLRKTYEWYLENLRR